MQFKNPEAARTAHISRFAVSGCSQQIDGPFWEDGTFQHTIIVYKGGELHLKNVRFVDCLFIVSFPKGPPTPARTLAEQILSAKDVPFTFTLSTG